MLGLVGRRIARCIGRCMMEDSDDGRQVEAWGRRVVVG